MTTSHLPNPHPGVSVALVVDVDGVVSAVHPAGDVWGDEVTAGHLFGPVRVSPTLCRHLDRLAALPQVLPLWLTSWPEESRRRMNPFPGRAWESLGRPVAAVDASATGRMMDVDRLDWWKWDELRAWLYSNRQIRSLVWCDDHLAEPLWADDIDPDGEDASTGEPRPRPLASALEPEDAPFLTTAAEVIGNRLAEIGVTATLIAPPTAVGLRVEDLARVEAALLAARPS